MKIPFQYHDESWQPRLFFMTSKPADVSDCTLNVRRLRFPREWNKICRRSTAIKSKPTSRLYE